MAKIKLKELIRRMLVDGKKTKESIGNLNKSIWDHFGELNDAFEPKNHDWLISQVVKNANFFLFDETTYIDKLPYGAQVKIKFDTTAQGEITAASFADTDQVQSVDISASGTHRFILNAAATDVLNYSEIKNNLDDFMFVYKMKGDGKGGVTNDDYWQFIRFEAKPAPAPTTGGGTTAGTVKTFTTGTVGSHIDAIIATLEAGGNAIFYRELAAGAHKGEITGQKVIAPSDGQKIAQVLTMPSGNYAVFTAGEVSYSKSGRLYFLDRDFKEVIPAASAAYINAQCAQLTSDGSILMVGNSGNFYRIEENSAPVVLRDAYDMHMGYGEYVTSLFPVGNDRFLVNNSHGTVIVDKVGKEVFSFPSALGNVKRFIKTGDDEIATLAPNGTITFYAISTGLRKTSFRISGSDYFFRDFVLLPDGNFMVAMDKSLTVVSKTGTEIVAMTEVAPARIQLMRAVGDEILIFSDRVQRIDTTLSILGTVIPTRHYDVVSSTIAANGDVIFGESTSLIQVGGAGETKRAAAPGNKNIEKIITVDKADGIVMVVQKDATFKNIGGVSLDATHTLKTIV